MSEKLKQFTLDEIKEHNKETDLWLIIHNKVYDLTKFHIEHPGGAEVLVEWGGRDASKDFDDVGHTSDAKDQMKQYLLGEVAEEDRAQPKAKMTTSSSTSWFRSFFK